MIWNVLIVTSVLVNIVALVKIYQLEQDLDVVDRINGTLSLAVYSVLKDVIEENNLKTKEPLVDVKEMFKEE